MYKGLSGSDYDKYVEKFDNRSTLSKVQQQFWEAKQTFLRKIVKREDDCVISYDSELDAKLELFKSIVETSNDLLLVIETYQDRICMLAHEESCIGRFLKECGKFDKNLISKMLTATGKTFYYTAQQRILLRNPLINMFQNLETFQYKAIADTMITIEQMEKQRTAYRASLLWMKSLSNKLDPDSYPELEKFRKVQNHVRKTKQKYDRKKIDCMQKVDMLNASRCNLLSSTLSNYQNSWITFWQSTFRTIKSISDCFDNCPTFEFNELKCLNNLTDNKVIEAKETVVEKNLLQLEDENLISLDNFETKKDEFKLYENNSSKDNLNENKFKLKENSFKLIEESFKLNEDNLNKKIDLIDNDDLFNLNIFENNSKTKSCVQEKNKISDDLFFSKIESEDLILLNDIMISTSKSSFLSDPLLPFTNQQDKLTNFLTQDSLCSNQVKNNSNQTTNESNQTSNQPNQENSKKSNEKKDWFSLFADLDLLNQKNELKNKGDC